MIPEAELIKCLQLINSENVGPVTFYKLLVRYRSLDNALEALPSLPKYRLFSKAQAQREYELARSKNIRIISIFDDEYPKDLKQINDAPPILYVRGRLDLLKAPAALAIVGARNASINGRKTASHIAYDLTNNGVLVVSGMARGIDSAAHKGAMYACHQKGATLAVLGTGVDVPYPAENRPLYEQICEQGAIVSEFPLGTEPQAQNFPRRNRLVSALTQGTLVVEATTHSGSLITARLALEQGKDIFAVPGSPQDARALGPNKLIKEGAILAESAEDILSHFNPEKQQQLIEYVDKLQKNADYPAKDNLKEASPPNDDIKQSETSSIIDCLSREGTLVDEIIRKTGQDAATVSLALLELELSGRIERQPGNKVALIK